MIYAFTAVVVFLKWQIWKISLQLLADGPAVALQMPLACDHKKELENFENHASLWADTQDLFGKKRRKLDTLLLFFIVLVNIVGIFKYTVFFSCRSCLRFKVLSVALLLTRLRLGFITDVITKVLIWSFFVRTCVVSSSSYPQRKKFPRIAQLFIAFYDKKSLR